MPKLYTCTFVAAISTFKVQSTGGSHRSSSGNRKALTSTSLDATATAISSTSLASLWTINPDRSGQYHLHHRVPPSPIKTNLPHSMQRAYSSPLYSSSSLSPVREFHARGSSYVQPLSPMPARRSVIKSPARTPTEMMTFTPSPTVVGESSFIEMSEETPNPTAPNSSRSSMHEPRAGSSSSRSSVIDNSATFVFPTRKQEVLRDVFTDEQPSAVVPSSAFSDWTSDDGSMSRKPSAESLAQWSMTMTELSSRRNSMPQRSGSFASVVMAGQQSRWSLATSSGEEVVEAGGIRPIQEEQHLDETLKHDSNTP